MPRPCSNFNFQTVCSHNSSGGCSQRFSPDQGGEGPSLVFFLNLGNLATRLLLNTSVKSLE